MNTVAMSPAQTLSDAFRVARNLVPFTAYPYQGQTSACPVCGSTAHRPAARVDRRLKRLPTVVCEGCGLLFTNPLPTEAELEHYYRRLYRLDYQLVFSPSGRHVRKRRREAAARADILSALLPPNATSLDFGAGSGEFVMAMLERGFDAHGFEPGESYAAHAREQLGSRIETKRWQEVDHAAAFDAVTSFHVFEHLRDPAEALRAAARWVKPGGLVYVEVPDAAAQLQRKGFGSLHFAHVVGFNRFNLELAAARAGLAPLRVVGPTSIVFRRTDETADLAALSNAGAALSRGILAERPLGSAYIRHHLGKIRRAALLGA